MQLGKLIAGVDTKDKFKTWRRDLGDTMINPYYVLRDEMLAILLDHIVYIINQWTSLPHARQVRLAVHRDGHCINTLDLELGGNILLFKEHF